MILPAAVSLRVWVGNLALYKCFVSRAWGLLVEMVAGWKGRSWGVMIAISSVLFFEAFISS